jgi:hypothetical protein
VLLNEDLMMGAPEASSKPVARWKTEFRRFVIMYVGSPPRGTFICGAEVIKYSPASRSRRMLANASEVIARTVGRPCSPELGCLTLCLRLQPVRYERERTSTGAGDLCWQTGPLRDHP